MSASNAQKPKQSSRWGSLFSGAVAGIESRLDTILAEDGASAAQRKSDLVRSDASKADHIVASAVRSSSAASRNRSDSPSSSQLPTARTSADSPSGTSRQALSRASPEPSVAQHAPSFPPPSDDPVALTTSSTPGDGHADDNGPPLVGGASLAAPNAAKDIAPELNATAGVAERVEEPDSSEPMRPQADSEALSGVGAMPKAPEELQALYRQAREDFERVELRRQEEAHENLERIDTLQAKLRYISREASTSARQAALEAGEDAVQKRLADQDDRIAQLMEEGIKLSKSEVSQTGTIRNLRAKTAEDANAVAELQRRLNRTERQLGDAVSDVSRLERERAQAVAKATRLVRVEREMSLLREDLSTKDQRIQRLERDLRDASDRVDENQKKASTNALELERRTTQSLRDDLANAKIEQGIRDDRARSDAERGKEQLQRETDRHRNAELALRNEISSLEGRLEIMRERTEEASAGSTGDAQAKLMRQIEILQSQYSVASENWQGIESSLQARVTAVERERDESARHEVEARKKARESASNARRLHDQLEDASIRSRVFEEDISEQKSYAGKLQARADELEASLKEAKAGFEREKQAWDSSLRARLDEERAKMQRQAPAALETTPSVADVSIALASPNSSLPRGMSSSDLHGISSRWLNSRGAELSPGLRSPQHFSRRSSAIPPQRALPDAYSVNEDTAWIAPGKASPGTPTLQTPDAEVDAFESSFSPSRNINDVVSTSTAGAGPSVQLVERMSASVRRLETEKAASKEELARLQTQRDEARKEIVALMSEVEAKREIDRKAAKLQNDLDEVHGKFGRMAEMFGEKTERCEELEADVADLKNMYRELVERTVTK